MDKELINAAEKLGQILQQQDLKLAIAESCTGGLLATALCASADSGKFFSSGFVTYTDSAKHRILGVSEATLRIYTAVSEATVREMALGAAKLAGEPVSLSISGYAGPDDGEDGTPAGTIWFAWHLPGGLLHSTVRRFEGDCEQVIHEATLFVMQHLCELLKDDS